jgi:predicted solute-binding protein
MTLCYLETNLNTSAISYPFQRGWIDTPDWLIPRDRVTPQMLQEEPACALIDAVEALRLLETHTIVTDIALVSTHQSTIRMHTVKRPDEVEHAVVQLGEVSATAEAVARSTIHHFYGIDVVDWNRSRQSGDVEILEGPEALRPAEDGYREDLVRAWFILTSLPLATHVFVASKNAVEEDPAAIEKMIDVLRRSVSVSEERRREVRRNLSEDYEVDRERLTDFLADQKPRLTKSGRKGWLDLANRVARAMELPSELNPDFGTFGKRDGE